MSACGFSIVNDRFETIAHCNDKPGHDGACNWLLSREGGARVPETLAEGILRRVGEMDAAMQRSHSLLHDAEREVSRMNAALSAILSRSAEPETRDLARLGLGLPTENPEAKLP